MWFGCNKEPFLKYPGLCLHFHTLLVILTDLLVVTELEKIWWRDWNFCYIQCFFLKKIIFFFSFPLRWHLERLVCAVLWMSSSCCCITLDWTGRMCSFVRPLARLTLRLCVSFFWLNFSQNNHLCNPCFIKKNLSNTNYTFRDFFSITSPILLREKLSIRGGATRSLYNKRGGSGKIKAVLSGAEGTRGR